MIALFSARYSTAIVGCTSSCVSRSIKVAPVCEELSVTSLARLKLSALQESWTPLFAVFRT